jgi:branched-chain amino acid aminotransferase
MSGFNGAKYCWMNGSVIETEKALVSAMEPIHLGIFEGIKAYTEGDLAGKGKQNIFAWKPHIDRLFRSATVNGLVMPYSKDELLEAAKETIRANNFTGNVYLQPRIWPKAGASRDKPESHVVFPAWEMSTLLGEGNQAFAKERRFMVSSWRRIATDALPPQAKSWANYGNSGLAGREVSRLGYNGAILLDNRGFVSESTGACLAVVKDGKVVTPPVTASILESVTRDYLLKHLPIDMNVHTEVRDLTRMDLYASEEAFLCGTGAEITPITSIDDIKIGDTYPGSVTTQIQKYYSEVVSGKNDKRRIWLTPVWI